MTSDATYAHAYARALLGAARFKAAVPAVQRDLATVMGAVLESADLRRWICRRVLSSPARRTAEAQQRLADLVTPLTLRLLMRMAAWNHLHLIPAVVQHFEHAVRKLKGRRTARVVCAQTPDDATLAAIRARLDADGAGRLELEVQTDPALLAGLTVRMEDQVIDASLAGRLARLRQALANPGRAAPNAATAPA
jgi:F-type H+-transporting ATPase subunit delta